MNRSGSILTRGKSSVFFKAGVTPFTSGFILQITETPYIPPSVVAVPGGGRSGNRSSHEEPKETKKLKRITVSVYINNKEYSETHIVDENISISASDVLVEWTEKEKPIITIKGADK